MVISALYNTIHFCQLDISLLNRGVETFDPGRARGSSGMGTSINSDGDLQQHRAT